MKIKLPDISREFLTRMMAEKATAGVCIDVKDIQFPLVFS